MLAQHFLKKVCDEENKSIEGFDGPALNAMQQYSWPGNVRELQNIVERAVLLGKGPQLGTQDLPSHINAVAVNQVTIAPQCNGRPIRRQPNDVVQEDEKAGLG